MKFLSQSSALPLRRSVVTSSGALGRAVTEGGKRGTDGGGRPADARSSRRSVVDGGQFFLVLRE